MCTEHTLPISCNAIAICGVVVLDVHVVQGVVVEGRGGYNNVAGILGEHGHHASVNLTLDGELVSKLTGGQLVEHVPYLPKEAQMCVVSSSCPHRPTTPEIYTP